MLQVEDIRDDKNAPAIAACVTLCSADLTLRKFELAGIADIGFHLEHQRITVSLDAEVVTKCIITGGASESMPTIGRHPARFIRLVVVLNEPLVGEPLAS